MNILVLWSSPNVDGLTASAAESLAEGVRRAGGTADMVQLNKCRIEHCMACGNGFGTCRSDGYCVIDDDLQDIYDRMLKADGVAFVTAVYWHDLTEVMKAFMDRLRCCEANHNHSLADKKALIVACAGGTGNGATECLVRFEDILRHMQMKAWDRMPVTRFNKDYNLPSLKVMGELFVKRLEEGFK